MVSWLHMVHVVVGEKDVHYIAMYAHLLLVSATNTIQTDSCCSLPILVFFNDVSRDVFLLSCHFSLVLLPRETLPGH